MTSVNETKEKCYHDMPVENTGKGRGNKYICKKGNDTGGQNYMG